MKWQQLIRKMGIIKWIRKEVEDARELVEDTLDELSGEKEDRKIGKENKNDRR